MSYATDGKCHNSNSDNGADHSAECGAPAVWLGISKTGHRSGFCDACKQHGLEAKHYSQWSRLVLVVEPSDPLPQAQAVVDIIQPKAHSAVETPFWARIVSGGSAI